MVKKEKKAIKETKPLLFCAYPKSGQTWARFVMHNYFNILRNNATKTLTFEELNALQSARLKDLDKKEPIKDLILYHEKEGFPLSCRTHSKQTWHFQFFTVIYIMRNALDTLVSRYFYNKAFETPFGSDKKPSERAKLFNIDHFVRRGIKEIIAHRKETLPNAHVVLHYDKLRKNPNGFKKILLALGEEIDVNAFKKAIAFSSFDNIKKMASETGQERGMGGIYFKGEFLRDGRSDQYKEYLKPETIAYVTKLLKKNNVGE